MEIKLYTKEPVKTECFLCGVLSECDITGESAGKTVMFCSGECAGLWAKKLMREEKIKTTYAARKAAYMLKWT